MTIGNFEMDKVDYDNIRKVYDIIKAEYDSDITSDEMRDLGRELERFETYAGQLMINATTQYLKRMLSK